MKKEKPANRICRFYKSCCKEFCKMISLLLCFVLMVSLIPISATASDYKQQEYYDKFPVMRLFTPQGDFIIELFAGTIEDGSFDTFKFSFENDKAFLEYINSFRSKSVFNSQVEVTAEDIVVTLCTCSYETSNSRFVVLGKLVPITQ